MKRAKKNILLLLGLLFACGNHVFFLCRNYYSGYPTCGETKVAFGCEHSILETKAPFPSIIHMISLNLSRVAIADSISDIAVLGIGLGQLTETNCGPRRYFGALPPVDV